MENQDVAILGGGCFWCLEAVYLQVRGVLSVESGYCGGHVTNPNYEQVGNGHTGHAEVVKLVFDPQQISYRELLEIFFVIHDPTTLNRQGNDIGTQYRSVIFYQNLEQQTEARRIIEEMNPHYQPQIVTEVCAAMPYYPAEAYHQNYFNQHPDQGYCAWVVAPKIKKFQQTFADKRKPGTGPG